MLNPEENCPFTSLYDIPSDIDSYQDQAMNSYNEELEMGIHLLSSFQINFWNLWRLSLEIFIQIEEEWLMKKIKGISSTNLYVWNV